MPMIHPLSFLQDSDSEQDEAAAAPENPPRCAGSISSHAAAVPAAAAGPAVAARSHAAAEAATGMQASSDEPPARKRMRVAAGSVCMTIKQEVLPPAWPEGAFVKEEAEEVLPPAWPEGAFVKQEAERGLPPAWPEGAFVKEEAEEAPPPAWPEGAFVKQEAERGLPPAWPEGVFVKQEAERGLPPAWPEGAFVKEEQQEQRDPQQQAQEVASGSGAGGSGSSSQGRKIGSQNVQALVHAFHCTEPACHAQFTVNNAADLCATCAGTKQVLKRMEVHVQQCPTRRAQQSAQQGGPPPQQAECKVCKLWEGLHRMRSSSGQQQSVQQRGGMQPSAAARGQPNQRELRQMMQDDPAQLKQILLSHVRACKDGQCKTCHKLRERIKSRAACQRLARLCDDELAQGQHDQQPPSTGQPHDLGGDVLAPMISLSVPVLLTTVKTLMPPETHEQLDQMLQRYMQKEIGKQQVCAALALLLVHLTTLLLPPAALRIPSRRLP